MSLQNEDPFLLVGNFDRLYNSVDDGVVLSLRLFVGKSGYTIFPLLILDCEIMDLLLFQENQF